MGDPEPSTEPVTLAESLVALQAQRAEGTVIVTLKANTTRVFLRGGSPVAVHTDEAQPTGDADTVWETLVGCLQWVEPTIVFEPEQTIPDELAGEPCQIEPLILEAVRRQFDLQELDAAIGPFMAHRPRVLGDVAAIAERCGLYGADEQDFVMLASRAETVEDLLVEGPVDLLEGYQLLYGLVLLGAVSLHDPSEVWDEAEAAPTDGLDEVPIDDLDEEPIDAFDDDASPEPPSSDRLSQDVADAFDPGLAEFLLDVVQTEPPSGSEPVTVETDEPDDSFPPLDQDSLPPPPRERLHTEPSALNALAEEDDFPPLDPDDSLPPPPKDRPFGRAREESASAPSRPSRQDRLQQADEDARRIVAEAQAARARETPEPPQPATSNRPPRDPSPPREVPKPRRDPRAPTAAPQPQGPQGDQEPRGPQGRPPEPTPSRPGARRDPRTPDRRSAGGRVIVEERVSIPARDPRTAVRDSRRPVATSVRPRPVVTRRKRALPSNPAHPVPPSLRDSSPSRESQSPSTGTSGPSSPAPRVTPPATRRVTPAATRRVTPAVSRAVTPPGRGTPPRGRSTPPGTSSRPRGSNPALPSDPGPRSHPGRSFTPPPHSAPGGADDDGVSERQKQLAQLHLKKGKRFLYRNNAARALPELEKAAELDPESLELQLFALWARFTVDPGDATAAKTTERELKALAGKTMSDDRKFGFAHFVMGQLALREGRNGDAVRSLGAAIKLDPDNQDAKRGHQIAKRRATK